MNGFNYNSSPPQLTKNTLTHILCSPIRLIEAKLCAFVLTLSVVLTNDDINRHNRSTIDWTIFITHCCLFVRADHRFPFVFHGRKAISLCVIINSNAVSSYNHRRLTGVIHHVRREGWPLAREKVKRTEGQVSFSTFLHILMVFRKISGLKVYPKTLNRNTFQLLSFGSMGHGEVSAEREGEKVSGSFFDSMKPLRKCSTLTSCSATTTMY